MQPLRPVFGRRSGGRQIWLRALQRDDMYALSFDEAADSSEERSALQDDAAESRASASAIASGPVFPVHLADAGDDGDDGDARAAGMAGVGRPGADGDVSFAESSGSSDDDGSSGSSEDDGSSSSSSEE